jgi:hypothetical protein
MPWQDKAPSLQDWHIASSERSGDSTGKTIPRAGAAR